MKVDVILGINVDTSMWISKLKAKNSSFILVVDYETTNIEEWVEDVLYASPIVAKRYLTKYKIRNFYKSIYAYPNLREEISSINVE